MKNGYRQRFRSGWYSDGCREKEMASGNPAENPQKQKYIGDALLQKTYTVDFLEKKRVPNAGTSTAGLYGITEERDLSCGAAALGWNMVREPAMPMLSMNQNYKTLWFEPLIWHLVKRILCTMSCREM